MWDTNCDSTCIGTAIWQGSKWKYIRGPTPRPTAYRLRECVGFDSHGRAWLAWHDFLENNRRDISTSAWDDSAWGPWSLVNPDDSIIENLGPRLASGGGKLWCIWFGGPDAQGSRFSVFASCRGESTWGARMQISPLDGFTHWWGDPWVDSLGNPGVVWVEAPHGVVYYSKYDGAEWSPALALSDTQIFAYVYGPPRIASDGSGGLHVCFCATPVHSPGVAYIYYARFDGNHWLPCQKLSQESLVIDCWPHVAASGPGNVWAVFDREDAVDTAATYATHFDGTKWSSEVRLDGGLANGDCCPDVALDRSGNPWAVWFGNGGTAILFNRFGDVPIAERKPPRDTSRSVDLWAESPVTRAARLTFRLPVAGRAKIEIYEQSGRIIRSFNLTCSTPGKHILVWDGRDALGRPVSDGVYLCRLDAAGSMAIAKTVLVSRGTQ